MITPVAIVNGKRLQDAIDGVGRRLALNRTVEALLLPFVIFGLAVIITNGYDVVSMFIWYSMPVDVP